MFDPANSMAVWEGSNKIAVECALSVPCSPRHLYLRLHLGWSRHMNGLPSQGTGWLLRVPSLVINTSSGANRH